MAKMIVTFEDVTVRGKDAVRIGFEIDRQGAAGDDVATQAIQFGVAIKRLWDAQVLSNLAPLVCSDLFPEDQSSDDVPHPASDHAESVAVAGAPDADAIRSTPDGDRVSS